MPAVADSSVIIHLAAIAQLDLLRQFHGSLLVPPAVWDEVVVQGRAVPEHKS
jgi:predicted nucleic acid-binding protein